MKEIDNYMENQTVIKGKQFATNGENCGVFELVNGAYSQHRGTGQTPTFKTTKQFRRYVLKMLRPDTQSEAR